MWYALTMTLWGRSGWSFCLTASRFAVASHHRNNGIGKILMNVVDKVMTQNHVKVLRLHTASKVAALIRFYYGRGFYIAGVENSRGYPRAELIKEYSEMSGRY